MKKMTYEEAIKRLQQIVSDLNNGEQSLEASLKLFEEGTQLTQFCNKTLNDAQQKITTLENN